MTPVRKATDQITAKMLVASISHLKLFFFLSKTVSYIDTGYTFDSSSGNAFVFDNSAIWLFGKE